MHTLSTIPALTFFTIHQKVPRYTFLRHFMEYIDLWPWMDVSKFIFSTYIHVYTLLIKCGNSLRIVKNNYLLDKVLGWICLKSYSVRIHTCTCTPYAWSMECTTFAPVINVNVKRNPNPNPNIILILILTLPWTKNPIITLTLTLCYPRYRGRSNCRRSKCRITQVWQFSKSL